MVLRDERTYEAMCMRFLIRLQLCMFGYRLCLTMLDRYLLGVNSRTPDVDRAGAEPRWREELRPLAPDSSRAPCPSNSTLLPWQPDCRVAWQSGISSTASY